MATCAIDQPSGKNRLFLQLKLEEGAKVQSPPRKDQYERDMAPLVPKEWPAAEEARSGGPARGLDAGRISSDQRIGMAPEGSDYYAGLRRAEPSLHVPPPPSGFKNDQLASNSPSIGRRMFRTLARFFIAALIGGGAMLAWQSHGDEAKEMAGTWAPSLGWLLSVSTTKSPPDGQVSAQEAALPQSAPVTQRPAPAAAATSPEVVQQLEPMARDLAVVRRSLEQLAAKQEQMAQNIATLQAVEQDIRQRMSSLPPSRAVPIPPHKPPQPAAQPPAAQPPAAQSPAVQSSSAPPPPPPPRPPLPLR